MPHPPYLFCSRSACSTASCSSTCVDDDVDGPVDNEDEDTTARAEAFLPLRNGWMFSLLNSQSAAAEAAEAAEAEEGEEGEDMLTKH